jgi:lipoprotein NlpD
MTSGFASADPARKGIKIAGNPGEAIRAAEGGEVVYSGSGLIGYGRLIIVKHNENYLSAYGYNRKLLVKEGDRVTKGEQIAEMGESNRGQAQLHFEIRRDGKPVDPVRLLPRR